MATTDNSYDWDISGLRNNPNLPLYVLTHNHEIHVISQDYHVSTFDTHQLNDPDNQVNQLFSNYQPASRTYPSHLLSKIQSFIEDQGDVTIQDTCCICYEDNAGRYVLDPCGHSSICITCISMLQNCKCPLCRAEIVDVTAVNN